MLELPDAVVMEVLAIVMAETLASGSDVIEMLGPVLNVDMADYWVTDAAFYEALRDREVALAILAEVGGSGVANANAKEKGKTIKGLIADFLTGENGRPKVKNWVPRWMRFPPAAYTGRGGVPTVSNANRARWIAESEAEDAERAAREVEVDGSESEPAEAETDADTHVEVERLAA
jgi:ParB family transcriptional regulator, chromosome partitioning protein